MNLSMYRALFARLWQEFEHLANCHRLDRGHGQKHKHTGALEDPQWLNPRVGGCCLADEDFVGRMSKLIRGVIKGRAVTKLMGAFVEQYARAVLVRWSGAECGPL